MSKAPASTIVVVTDRSEKNKIRDFEGKVDFFYKGRRFQILKRYNTKECNVLDLVRGNMNILEISWHNTDKPQHQIQMKPGEDAYSTTKTQPFMWEALQAVLRHVGYVEIVRTGDDDQYDYRIITSLAPFTDEVRKAFLAEALS